MRIMVALFGHMLEVLIGRKLHFIFQLVLLILDKPVFVKSHILSGTYIQSLGDMNYLSIKEWYI